MASKYLHKRIKHGLRWKAAQAWLRLHPGVQTVAIAGSVGKTTTKDLVASVLAMSQPTVKSRANFDPIFNLPQTALRIRRHGYFVAEMGIDAPGQMDNYLTLVAPDIAIITELSHEHTDTDHLQSLEVAIAEEWKLIDHLPNDKLAILNGDNSIIRQKAKQAACRTIFYGFEAENDVRITSAEQRIDEVLTPKLSIELEGRVSGRFEAPLLGKHNAMSMSAAIITGHVYGLSQKLIQKGLANAELPPHRLEVKKSEWGVVIDDTYNSSPKAASAAIDTLAEIDASGAIVLGDMLELGDYTQQAHFELGELAASRGLGQVIVTGDWADDIARGYVSGGGHPDAVQAIFNHQAIADALASLMPKTVLLKASRGVGLTHVVEAIVR